MSTLIPNGNSYVAFTSTLPAVQSAPTASEVAAATAVTDFLISLNASFQGNAVPTPKISSTFETSIPGTQTATFTGEFYHDSVYANDIAFNLFLINGKGVFYISRFGGTGTDKLPIAADRVDVWEIRVISRTNSAISSNTAQTFTLTCSVSKVPSEGVLVAA
jgi:hypothetical protein